MSSYIFGSRMRVYIAGRFSALVQQPIDSCIFLVSDALMCRTSCLRVCKMV